MPDKPIIFTGESIPAIIAGRKTQTRLVIPSKKITAAGIPGVAWTGNAFINRYQTGDLLWVRETWRETGSAMMDDGSIASFATRDHIIYKADAEWDGPWRSPIHMPRRASRITLECIGVRVERLQDITEEDAEAEGVGRSVVPTPATLTLAWAEFTFMAGFQNSWNSLHGEKHPWESNPWVWVISFRVLEVK